MDNKYTNDQIQHALNPQPAPYKDLDGFWKHTANASAPTFEPGSGEEELHLRGAHEIKKAAGAGFGTINGAGRADPNALFKAAVNLDGDYDPQYDYLRREIMQQALRNNPEAGAKFEATQQNQEFAQQHKYTPEMQEVRGQLPEEKQQEFDNRIADEKLNRVAPIEPGEEMSEMEKAHEKRRGDIRRNSSSAGEKTSDAVKATMQDTLLTRFENGQIDRNTYLAAMDELNGTNRAQYITTNSASGSLLAAALGMPDKLQEGTGAKGGDINHTTYRIGDLSENARTVANTRAEELESQRHLEIDRAAEAEARARNIALDDEDRAIAAEDRATRQRLQNEKQALMDQGFETRLHVLPDGSKIIAFRGDGTQGWQFRNYKDDGNEADNIQPYAGGWYQTVNGQTKFFDSEDGEMGADGSWYPFADDIRNGANGVPYNYGKKSSKPEGIPIWSAPDKQPLGPAKEKPPVGGARKAPDGKWYVEKEGKYYPVEER